MAIGNSKISLRGSRLRRSHANAGEDPMAGLSNLMDVMLVFACGLIIALIARYNVDMNMNPEELGDAEVFDSQIDRESSDVASGGSSYRQLGQVYEDVETGEKFLVRPSGSASEGSKTE